MIIDCHTFHNQVYFHTTQFPIEWAGTMGHGAMMQKNGLRQHYSYTLIITDTQVF